MLCWDVSVTCPLAESHINAAGRQSGAAAELAASGKKYVDLDGRSIVEPTAIETPGVFNTPALPALCSRKKNFREYVGSQRSELSIILLLRSQRSSGMSVTLPMP